MERPMSCGRPENTHKAEKFVIFVPLAVKPDLGWASRMGLAKLFITGVTMAVLTCCAPAVFASAQKGLNAFQRGKYEEAL